MKPLFTLPPTLLTLCLTLLIVCAPLIVSAPAARASTVVQMEFAEVVETAELIFEARVLSTEARQSGSRAIHTYVEFEIIEILKGEYARDTIELRFLGGRVGDLQLQITDMQIPQPGETGFYFVESLNSRLVHPLVGWAQGHYPIAEDSQGEHVTTARGEAISSLATQRNAVQRGSGAPLVFSHGTAGGVNVQQLNGPQQRINAMQFKATVRDLINSQEP